MSKKIEPTNTMTREEIIAEISALKILLRDSDYVALKVTEAMMNGESTEAFAEKIAARKTWRVKLNELEALLEEMPEPEYEPEPPMCLPETEEAAESTDENVVLDVVTTDEDAEISTVDETTAAADETVDETAATVDEEAPDPDADPTVDPDPDAEDTE